MTQVDHICSVFLRRIILRMKELGLSQTALAKRMKVSRPYITKVLSGDVNITFGTAYRFARALGMDFVPGLAPAPELSTDFFHGVRPHGKTSQYLDENSPAIATAGVSPQSYQQFSSMGSDPIEKYGA